MNARDITSVVPIEGDVVFTRHRPCPELRDRVEAFWTLSCQHGGARLRVIPDGRIDLVFDLDTREAFVSGPRREPLEVLHDRPTRLLGVTLSVEAAAILLDVDIGSLESGWRGLETLLGPLAGRVADAVADASSVEAKLSVLETLVMARVGAPDSRVSRAVAEIARSGGAVAIAELSRHSGASARNLSRLFERWTGLTPKAFARVARTQEVLRRLRETPDVSLKALAAELGFSDQAHMSREVRRLAGDQPKRLAETFKRESELFKPAGAGDS